VKRTSQKFRGTLSLTGLSGAGKSTIAELLRELLKQEGISSYLLDGDNFRKGLNSDLGFGERDRAENVRRLGEVALLFANEGYFSIVSAISAFVADRKMVRERHRSFGVLFVEIYVATPLSV
jgi:bifunctional enzyme CysN/CysC